MQAAVVGFARCAGLKVLRDRDLVRETPGWLLYLWQEAFADGRKKHVNITLQVGPRGNEFVQHANDELGQSSLVSYVK
jgi:hypothetical protein